MKSYTLFKLKHAKAYLSHFWAWRKLSRKVRREHPYCAICGSTKRLEVHHIYPRHLYPSRALDPTNLIVLCRSCHLRFGHLGDWEQYNPYVKVIANFTRLWQKKGYYAYREAEEKHGRTPKKPHIHI